MSDDNTPKLRLRPKLGSGTPAVTPTPVNPPVRPMRAAEPGPAAPIATPSESKSNPPRAKLALKPEVPVQSADPVAEPVAPPANELPTYIHDPREFPPPPTKQLLVPPRAKPPTNPGAEGNPADVGAAPPFPAPSAKAKFPVMLDAPPPSRLVAAKNQQTWPAVLDAPPPAGLAPAVAPGASEEEPAEIAAIRKASTFPFPAPTAKFPPLPGLGGSIDSAPAEANEQEGFLKKLLLIGALVILLLAAAVFAYFKFFAKPTPSSQSVPAKVSVSPEQAAEKTHTAAEKPRPDQPATAPPVSATESNPAATKPAAENTPINPAPVPDAAVASAVPPATPEPEVVPPVPVKPPPPQPSLAFKAWVINLRIRGVRGGDAQRVFIDKTSYVPGDVVNQQLGIIFTGYDESTRMLTFQDKTGAVFERRH